MSTKAEALQAVLPALQHMARFRGANREVVCRQRGIRTADLEAVVSSVFGSWARVDEESLEEIARGLGVVVPPYQPVKPGYIGAVIEAERPPVRLGRPPKAKPVDRGQSTVDRKPEKAKPAAPAPTTESDPWTGHSLQLRKARTYLAIFTAIAVRGWEKVKPVLASEFNVKDSAFRVWKLKYFGTGELVGPKFERFHAWLRAQAGPGEAAIPPTHKEPSAAASTGATQSRPESARAGKGVASGAADGSTPCSPANTEAGKVLDSLADLEDWTEISRPEPRVDAVSSDSRPTRGLILAEHLLEQLGEHLRVRLFVSPSKTRLALAFGAEGLLCLQSRRGLRIPVKDWAERVAAARQEWHVAELHTAGVVQLVLELNREGRAA